MTEIKAVLSVSYFLWAVKICLYVNCLLVTAESNPHSLRCNTFEITVSKTPAFFCFSELPPHCPQAIDGLTTMTSLVFFVTVLQPHWVQVVLMGGGAMGMVFEMN